MSPILAGVLGYHAMIAFEVGLFVGARYLVARGSGVRGLGALFGFDRAKWASAAPARRWLFTLAGPAAWYLGAVLLFAVGLKVGGRPVVDTESLRAIPSSNGPAAAAGMHDGDRVVSVDGAPVASWDGLRAAISPHKAETIAVVVERDGTRLTLRPTVADDGKIAIGPWIEHREVGLGAAIGTGIVEPLRIQYETAHGLVRMIVGSERAEVSGPVAVMREVGRPDGRGQGTALLAALASYSLAVPSFVALVLHPWRRRAKRT